MIGAQDFDYSVIQCGFLCICPPWGLLIFIDLWAYRSVKFGKNNFFIFFPLPLLLIFRDSSCMYVRLPSLSHKSMFCPLLKVFSSLFCILYNFAIYSSLGSYISLLLQGLIHHYSHLTQGERQHKGEEMRISQWALGSGSFRGPVWPCHAQHQLNTQRRTGLHSCLLCGPPAGN